MENLFYIDLTCSIVDDIQVKLYSLLYCIYIYMFPSFFGDNMKS